MTEKESVSQVPCVIFFMKIPKISELDEIYSPIFLVQNVPWKVRIEKAIHTTKESLAIYLECHKKVSFFPLTDSHAGSLSVKLLSWDENSPDLFEDCVANVYDNSGTYYGNRSLIGWDELLSTENSYVRNDTINLEIKIKVVDPYDEKKSEMELEKVDQSCEMGCVTTLRFKVTNLQNLIAVRSPQFNIHKLVWNLTVKKSRDKNSLDSQLGINLGSVDDTPLNCKAKVSITIFSSKIGAKTLEESIPEDFDYLDTSVASLLELERPENGFINNDSLRMEVQIRVGCCQSINAPNTRQHEVKFKLECAICLHTIDNKAISSTLCGHIFCTACIEQAIQIKQLCPLCNNVITLETLRRTISY